MKTNNLFKKITAIMLILTMILTTFTSCGKDSTEAIDDTEAKIMRIVKIEGEVSHNDNDAKEQERLHSKDTVGTEKSSNAYITLDEYKAVRLDENSEIEVEEENKGGERLLTLALNEGSLFFDVQQALPDDEFYNIVTSNMTCGIRGTSGVVEENEDNTTIYLISGKVDISDENNESEISLLAGNKAVIKKDISSPDDIIVTEIDESDIPNFVTEEDLANIEFGNSETATSGEINDETAETTSVKTFEELETAIADASSSEAQTITIDENITISRDLTIPENVKLVISFDAIVTVSPQVTLTVDGEIENNGAIIGA